MAVFGLTRLTLLAGVMAAAVVPSHAATYFALQSTNGAINPGILVGFNPQPDPPGFPISFDLTDSTTPALSYYPPGPCDTACSADLKISFSGLGIPTNYNSPSSSFTHIPPSDFSPQNLWLNSFSFVAAGHSFDVEFGISGPTAVLSWGAFNPQPDPPGFEYQFSFQGDPQFAFNMYEDETLLQFAQTPLPAALPLFATGLGVMGLLGWRKKRKAPAALNAE